MGFTNRHAFVVPVWLVEIGETVVDVSVRSVVVVVFCNPGGCESLLAAICGKQSRRIVRMMSKRASRVVPVGGEATNITS